MFFNTLAVASVFVASALSAAEPAPYMLGKMSLNTAFGLMQRQAAGYQPSQTYCGPGTDCASSCGAGYVQCPSSDGELHCFDPAIQQTCCPDGTGNSCDQGYFCTEDSSGNTWCCPNGLSLAACAASYSLTGTLISETATASPTSYSTSSPATVSASPSGTGTTTYPTTTSTGKVIYSTPHSNVTISKTGSSTATTSLPVQVTNAANLQAIAGLPVLALAAAGAVLAM